MNDKPKSILPDASTLLPRALSVYSEHVNFESPRTPARQRVSMRSALLSRESLIQQRRNILLREFLHPKAAK
jgi:hypothetical protein